MYVQKPLLSLVTVIMLVLGTYLFFCGPKKKEEKRSRELRKPCWTSGGNMLMKLKWKLFLLVYMTENEPRRRNVNRTSNDSDTAEDTQDTHAN